MKTRIAGIAALLLSVVSLSAFYNADNELVKKIAERLDAWLADHPQEKLYLHLDKPYYATGDTVWFKAYTTIGADHKLSALSGMVNVELIGADDSLTQKINVPLAAGMGWGEFVLPDSLRQGTYRIRAYTNWMRNQDEAYYFDRQLTVLNAITNKVYTTANYTYTTVAGVPQVNVVVSYTDISGNAYANKPVSYEVALDARRMASGKGVTDAAGNLVFSFPNKKGVKEGRGRLETKIKLDEKEWISNTMPVQSFVNDVDVQFFPESGYLINGVASKLAFKATATNGLGMHIKGVIKDNDGAEVTKLESQHLGMGVCMLLPQAGKTYKAYLTTDDGFEKVVDIPAARSSGYVLTVDSSNPLFVLVRLLAPEGTPAEPLTVVAQAGGKLLYAAVTKEGSTDFRANIRKNRFPTGIVQFTLFAANGRALNERIVFIQNNDALKLNVSTPQQVYKPRQKVDVTLKSLTNADSVTEGSFSVSVINESRVKVDELDERTIFTDVLLTSDIKGYVEQPNYYFINENDETRADLDVLMLTQGYRRFNWEQLMNGAIPAATFKPQKQLSVSGTVLEKGKPLPGAHVTIFNSKGSMFAADTVADANGKFSFNNLFFADSAAISVQATNAKGKKSRVDVVLDNTAPQPVTHNPLLPLILTDMGAATRSYLQLSKQLFNEQVRNGINDRGILLNEVIIREKKKKETDYSTNLNGAGRADQVVTAKELSTCSTLATCLAGRLTGVMIRNGIPYSTRSNGGPMQIMMDGMPVEPDYLQVINPNDVETIEVLRSIGNIAIYGSQGANGVILITTKRGKSGYTYDPTPAPGISHYNTIGYHPARLFYSPKYEVQSAKNVPDLRTTIYWDPTLYTEKGSTAVSYYNADEKGNYRVVVEGIDGYGRLGRQIYRYKVE